MPFHSRWRHFVWNGEDRWASLDRRTRWPNAAARGRAAFDLAIVSVLLDAGAGPQWQYRDRRNRAEHRPLRRLGARKPRDVCRRRFLVRSERSAAGRRRRAGAACRRRARARLSGHDIQSAGRGRRPRAICCAGSATLIASKPDVFGRKTRRGRAACSIILPRWPVAAAFPRRHILAELLRHLGPIWPSRLTLGGVPLGDCWRHPSLTTADATNGLVPLHKLSQWLAYSLIEPLQWSGIAVTDIDGLTGLSEYRNGGLFVDLRRVAASRSGRCRARVTMSPRALVVEWRALTVALLDKLADEMRRRLGMDAKPCRLPKCWKAAPGRPDASSRGKSAPTARRRSK